MEARNNIRPNQDHYFKTKVVKDKGENMRRIVLLTILIVCVCSSAFAAESIEIASVDCSSIITNFKVGEQDSVDLDQYSPPQIVHNSDGCIKYVWTQNKAGGPDQVAVTIDKANVVIAVAITEHSKKYITELSNLITSVYGKKGIPIGPVAEGDSRNIKWQALQNNNSYTAVLEQHPDSIDVVISTGQGIH